MNWLSPLSLLLLAAVPVLLWLALRRQRPRAITVGTLLIWKRVAQAATSAAESKRRIEPQLWLLLAACTLGAFGAARPAMSPAASTPEVAVYIERLAESGPEPALRGLLDRAREAAPGARLQIWFAGSAPELDAVNPLNPAPVAAELAQFVAASRDMARIMFLCEPETGAAGMGLVLPRATAPREDIVFEARADEELHLRMSRGEGPRVEGAHLRGVETLGREYVRSYAPNANVVRVSNATQSITLKRAARRFGAGPDWQTARHKALLAALQPDPGEPEVWLGGEGSPAIRTNRGRAAAFIGLPVTFDSQHTLFRELPLAQVDLTSRGLLLERAPGVRPLASVMIEGEASGHLVTLSADGKILNFAGDPFADSSLTAAALLLDNAIGVVTGTRPSERQQYELAEGTLPTRRQAMAEPFEPRGTMQAGRRPAEADEFSPWLLAFGALCALAAAAMASAVRKGGSSGRNTTPVGKSA